MSDYWKPNVDAMIAGDVNPWDLATWDEASRSYYFPDDWKQYDSNDIDRIYSEWLEPRLQNGKAL